MGVSIEKVAEAAQVSARTAYRVLNKEAHVHPRTRERVLKAAAELNYQPNVLARSLVLRKTSTIGVVFPDSRNPIFGEFTSLIEEHARARGYECCFLHSEGVAEREAKCLNLAFESRVDGLIVFPNFAEANRELYGHLIRNRTPLVIRAAPGLLEGVDIVTVDLERAGYLATRHLLALGHKHVGILLSHFAMGHMPGRLLGYRRAHEEFSVAIRPEYEAPCGHRLEDGHQAILDLLKRCPQVTAIFCHNDYLALSAFKAAQAAGRTIPNDLAIVGLDNIELGEYCQVPLTTISHIKETEAQALVDMLCDRIDDRRISPRCLTLQPELVVRASCGAHLHGRADGPRRKPS